MADKLLRRDVRSLSQLAGRTGVSQRRVQAELTAARLLPDRAHAALDRAMGRADDPRRSPLPADEAASVAVAAVTRPIVQVLSSFDSTRQWRATVVDGDLPEISLHTDGELVLSRAAVEQNRDRLAFVVARGFGPLALEHLPRQLAVIVGLQGLQFLRGGQSKLAGLLTRALLASAAGVGAGAAYGHRQVLEADHFGVRLAERAGLPIGDLDDVDWNLLRGTGLGRLSPLPSAESRAAQVRQLRIDRAEALVEQARALQSEHLFDRAQPLLEQAFAEQSQLLGPVADRTLETGSLLVETLRERERVGPAIQLSTELVRRCLAAFGDQDLRTARAWFDQAWNLSMAEQLPEALDLLGRVLGIRDRELGEGHRETLRAGAMLCVMMLSANDPRALHAHREVEAAYVEHLGPSDRDTLIMRGHTATALYLAALSGEEGDDREAMLDEATDIRTRVEAGLSTLLEEGDRELLAARVHLVESLNSRGRRDEALALADRTFMDQAIHYGAFDSTTLYAQATLATTELGAGRHRQGLARLREAVSLAERHLSAEHPMTIMLAGTLIAVLNQVVVTDISQARAATLEIVALRRLTADGRAALAGPHHHSSRLAAWELIDALYRARLFDPSLLQEARERLESLLNATLDVQMAPGGDLPVMRARLGAIYAELGLGEEAEALVTPLLLELRDTDPDSDERWNAEEALARAHAIQGRHDLAVERWQAVLDHRTEGGETASPLALVAEANLAVSLAALGRHLEARDHLLNVWRALAPQQLANDPLTLMVQSHLAATYLALGEPAEAVVHLRFVWESFRETRGAADPMTLQAESELAAALFAAGEFTEAIERAQEVLDLLSKELQAIPGFDQLPFVAEMLVVASRQRLGETLDPEALADFAARAAAALGDEHPVVGAIRRLGRASEE